MINKELVKESIMLMGGFESGEVEAFDPFIDAAVAYVSGALIDEADENDPRIIQLAAAKAYKSIILSATEADGFTSFSAGSISVVQKTDSLGNAKDLYAAALSDCAGLLNDSGFAFLGV